MIEYFCQGIGQENICIAYDVLKMLDKDKAQLGEVRSTLELYKDFELEKIALMPDGKLILQLSFQHIRRIIFI